MKNFKELQQNFLKIEKMFAEYATKSSDAIRVKPQTEDIRTPFFRDIDRIIHSLSYTRYINKTQVYSYKENDHISKRMVHVQLVSKIARTIGRALGLNTDLIEAIALGHDVGHTPLGHAGEAILDEISQRELNEYFSHNIQSVRQYMEIENSGEGLNLTIQVLDGIMCHNGEMVSRKYKPVLKSKEEFLDQYKLAYKEINEVKKKHPMTLEGCVVRISDIVAYIGRDIEDSINLGLFNRESLPLEIVQVLGNNNKDIVNNIVIDIIDNSFGKPYIEMSEEVYHALMNLKKFNYKNIYDKSLTYEEKEYYRTGMNKLFRSYLEAIEKNNEENIIFQIFLNNQNSNYLKNTSAKRKVLDFIAGMTDELFIQEVKRLD